MEHQVKTENLKGSPAGQIRSSDYADTILDAPQIVSFNTLLPSNDRPTVVNGRSVLTPGYRSTIAIQADNPWIFILISVTTTAMMLGLVSLFT